MEEKTYTKKEIEQIADKMIFAQQHDTYIEQLVGLGVYFLSRALIDEEPIEDVEEAMGTLGIRYLGDHGVNRVEFEEEPLNNKFEKRKKCETCEKQECPYHPSHGN